MKRKSAQRTVGRAVGLLIGLMVGLSSACLGDEELAGSTEAKPVVSTPPRGRTENEATRAEPPRSSNGGSVPLSAAVLAPVVHCQDGMPCSDGDACTQIDTCQAGVCVGSDPVECVAVDKCHENGICNPADGTCSSPVRPDGTPCIDDSACTRTDTCQAGTCVGGDPVECPAAGTCVGGDPVECPAAGPCQEAGTCDAGDGTCSDPVPMPDGSVCDDGDPCTAGDGCQAGECVAEAPACPPDPVLVAPPLDTSVATDLAGSTDFLFEGPGPIQVGADPDALVAERRALLRGRVSDRSGAPVPAAQVSVVDHPEHGFTHTRADGRYDLAVNGGETVTIAVSKLDYLDAQRSVAVDWQASAEVPEVVLVPLDSRVTVVAPESAIGIEVVRGSVMSDEEGSRQATLLFEPGTRVTMTGPGESRILDEIGVRATEYTVGPTGPAAMPGSLPATSGYTYAVEYTVDEALAAGATRVEFSRPVATYTDNFLDIPVGSDVPTGYYDRELARWIPAPDGRVVAVVGVTGGLADLDLDGDGDADSEAELAAHQVTPGERAELAGLYAPGVTLWRVLIDHFTPYDHNWPYGLPGDAELPPDEEPTAGLTDRDEDRDCGSIIGCQNQTLGEDLPLAGTPFRLRYQSDRVRGRLAERTIEIPLSGSSVPASLLRIDLRVMVAGQTQLLHFDPLPDLRHTFVWDGRDGYGRQVQGGQTAIVEVSFAYRPVRQPAAQAQASFAMVADQGGTVGRNFRRTELTLRRTWRVAVGGLQAADLGLGGWTLDAHHVFAPVEKILYEGTGRSRVLEPAPVALAGTGVAGDSGDGGPATRAEINRPGAVAVGPDGSVVIADTGNDAVRRVARNGIITTIARRDVPDELLANPGAEAPVSGGELPGWTEVLGTQWTQRLAGPAPAEGAAYFFAGAVATAEIRQDVDVSADGDVIDAGQRRYSFRGLVRSFDQAPVDMSRIIVEYRDAANTAVLAAFDSGEIGNRTAWQEVQDARIAPAGTRWIRIRLRSRRRSGSNNDGYYDNLSLTASNVDDPVVSTVSVPGGVAVAADQTVFVADTGNHRVIQIRPDGTSASFAGTGTTGFSGDDGPATQAQLADPRGLALTADGVLYIADTGNHRVRRVGLDGTITTLGGTGTAGWSGDGGPAAAAQMSRPRGVAVAPDGSVYLADTGNHRIRVIGADGVIRTFAGTGDGGFGGDGGRATSARLSSPEGIAAGFDGTVYIADTGNRRIRRVLPDGRIETFARDISGGTGGDPDATGFVAPVGIAVVGAFPVVADSSLHLVRRLTAVHPMLAADGERLVPSVDGTLLHGFAASGRHLHTYSARLGTLLLTFSYDPAGRLATVVDRHGNTTTIARDESGRPTAIVGPFGHTTGLQVGPDGYLASVTDPVGDTIALDYRADGLGLLERLTDGKGYTHTYQYDDLGRLIDDVMPVGRTTLARSGGAHDYAVEVTSALGHATRYDVERLSGEDAASCADPAEGRCQRRTMTLPNGAVTRAFVGASGHDTVVTADGSRIEAQETRELALGLFYPLRSVVRLPSGRQLVAERESTIQLADPADPLGARVAAESLTVRATEEAPGDTWQTVFDGSARTITTTSPTGRSAVATLDSLDRVERAHVPGTPHDVVYGWDARGRLASVTQGDRTTEYEYRPTDGTLWKVKNLVGHSGPGPLFEEHEIGVDADGRPTRLTYPDGATLGFGYDQNGNAEDITPPERPVHHTEYGPGDLSATYRPPNLGDGNPREKAYGYDADGEISTITAPDGGTTTFRYSSATGQIEAIELPAPWGQIAIVYESATTAGRADALVRTDPLGSSTLSFVHDGPEIVSTRWDSTHVRGTVAYDKSQLTAGRLLTETVDGDAVQYRFDADRLLVSAGAMTVSSRPDNGLRQSRTIGCVSDQVAPNAYGERESFQASCNGSPLLSTQYSYDLLGRVDTLTESVVGETPVTRGFTYDARSRLESVSESGFEIARYDYDANDNRIGSPGDVVVDAHDQLLEQGALSFTYTLNGEVATATDSTGTTAYTHDPFGTLRRVDLPSGDVIQYLVDPADRRIGKVRNGAFQEGFLHGSHDRPVARLDSAGAITTRFVYGTAFAPDYLVEAGQTYALVTDHLGSVRLVVNTAAGVIAQRLEYDELGQVVLDTSPGFQPFGYAGGLYDPETGLVQFGAREYDPRTGRFTTLEPLGFADGGNRYTYAGADPINRIDPSGLRWQEWGVWNYLDPVSDAAAGFGDAISFGATRKVRQALDVDDDINTCGLFYRLSGFGGELLRDSLLGAGALKLAGRAWRGLRGAKDAARGAKPSLSAHKEALKKVHAEVGGPLPKGKPGKFGSPQAGDAKKGYRLDPPHDGVAKGGAEAGFHFNWWDYTKGKRGRGGRSGAIPIGEQGQ